MASTPTSSIPYVSSFSFVAILFWLRWPEMKLGGVALNWVRMEGLVSRSKRKLLYCFLGIFVSYFIYGLLQENMWVYESNCCLASATEYWRHGLPPRPPGVLIVSSKNVVGILPAVYSCRFFMWVRVTYIVRIHIAFSVVAAILCAMVTQTVRLWAAS